MKYLVLGSSGQIGDALCNFLTEKGHEVLRFDIVDGKNYDLRIKDNTILKQYIFDCDFIFFLAFDVGGSRYLKKYQHTYEFIDNNLKILTNTFDIIKEYKKPFIFASSQMSNMSFSPYGITKSVGELLTKTLNGIVVKFWNVYGVEKDLDKSHVITDFILKAKNTGTIDMLTDGKEERQFLYSYDCCEALHILSQKYDDISRDEQLHITNFEWNKIIEIAEIIQKEIPCKIVEGKVSDDIQNNQKNKPDEYILNFWKPKTSLLQGIKNIIDYYKD